MNKPASYGGRAGAFTRVLVALAVPIASGGSASCGSNGFGTVRNPPRLYVELLDGPAITGTQDAPLDLPVGVALPFHIVVHALDASGGQDATFTRFVRLSSKPGAIEPIAGDGAEGRNILVKAGVSDPIEVHVGNAFGTTYIVAEDLGYIPVDPLRNPPPKCSNGVDDDLDGKVDYPADEGCAFANDDSEEGASYGEGASRPIFFRLPRIADIRGLQCDPTRGCAGNGRTPYPREQVQVDTGYRDDGTFAFDTVVTRLSSDGFYAEDLGDKRLPLGSPRPSPPLPSAFTSLFAFNFNAPPRMRVCDRLKSYGGTSSEFFGFTQMSYPTWTLEEWDPSKRLCLVPEAERLTPSTISNAQQLLALSAGLVRVETVKDSSGREIQKARVTPKFGPGDMPRVPNTPAGKFTAGPDSTNCDFDKNGKINSFAAGDPEGECSTACTADPECTEWSNYTSRSTFRITVTNSNGDVGAIQADASASAGFDPYAQKGNEIRSFSGTMTYFSGGAQFTIEARCEDDIIVDLSRSPFAADDACTSDADCQPAAGLPPGFKCIQLDTPGSPKACRILQANQLNPGGPAVKQPPPLACVFPRTFIDNNPQ